MIETQDNNIIVLNHQEEIKIATDKALLSRIIENLIKNAIEASNPKQTITIGYSRKNDNIVFSIHNQTFIPEDIQSKIFQRSFSTKGGGRGIGTFSIKYLTETYFKGKVYFTSTQRE